MNKATKITTGEYEYRGYRIVLGFTVLGDKSWMIEHRALGGTEHSTLTLTAAKDYIDERWAEAARYEAATKRIIAEDRDEEDYCTKLTQGCSIDHEAESREYGIREGECDTW